MTLLSALSILLVGAGFGILTTGLMSVNSYDEALREGYRKGWLEGYTAGYSKGKEDGREEGEKQNEPNQ